MQSKLITAFGCDYFFHRKVKSIPIDFGIRILLNVLFKSHSISQKKTKMVTKMPFWDSDNGSKQRHN
jgi:hypothetical protein